MDQHEDTKGLEPLEDLMPSVQETEDTKAGGSATAGGGGGAGKVSVHDISMTRYQMLR